MAYLNRGIIDSFLIYRCDIFELKPCNLYYFKPAFDSINDMHAGKAKLPQYHSSTYLMMSY